MQGTTNQTFGESHAEIPGTVGPNAVIQLRRALIDRIGERDACDIFRAAGQESVFEAPPREMIDERIPARLFKTLFDLLEERAAFGIAFQAGVLTADYVMAHRIPGAAKKVLQVLPPLLAGPMLMDAVAKNAWTFCGSGTFRFSTKPDLHAELLNNPLRMPGAAWHVGVFTRLLQALVCAEAKVRHRAADTPEGTTDRFLMLCGQAQLGKTCLAARSAGRRRACFHCVVD